MAITLSATAAVPVGTVVDYAHNVAPAGWLKANGAAISRTTYAALFSVIGTTFGVGDGSSTFNVPDGRGVPIRGWDDGRGLDSGRGFGTYQADAFETHIHSASSVAAGFHAHSVYDPSHDHTIATWVGSVGTGTGLGVANAISYEYRADAFPAVTGIGIYGDGTHSHTITVGAPTTGSVATETRMKNLALLKIIKF
jgi:microcystin-dependent protein